MKSTYKFISKFIYKISYNGCQKMKQYIKCITASYLFVIKLKHNEITYCTEQKNFMELLDDKM